MLPGAYAVCVGETLIGILPVICERAYPQSGQCGGKSRKPERDDLVKLTSGVLKGRLGPAPIPHACLSRSLFGEPLSQSSPFTEDDANGPKLGALCKNHSTKLNRDDLVPYGVVYELRIAFQI